MELVKLVILVKLEINYLEMKRTKIVDVLKSTDFGKEVCVKGWVRTHRSSKAVDFIALNDGSTIKNVQVVVDPSKFDEQLLKDITTGACICAVGTLVESQGAVRLVRCRLPLWKSTVYAIIPIPCRRRASPLR